MADTRFVVTTDQKPSLTALVRSLPAMLAGRIPDQNGIALGFRSRIGYAILAHIGPNFDRLGRGESGDDGTIWPPLSREYLAYGRRFGPTEKRDLVRGAGLDPKKNKYAPNEKKGLLTADQLKLWKRVYSRKLKQYAPREGIEQAKQHAAAVAWIAVKSIGGKTKLDVFGTRKVQMLVDTGYLRGSLEPGTIIDKGASAEYQKPSGIGSGMQEFDVNNPTMIIVGTNVEYAKYHHDAKKSNRLRRLWPSEFPQLWWDEIIGVAIQGLERIKELYLRA